MQFKDKNNFIDAYFGNKSLKVPRKIVGLNGTGFLIEEQIGSGGNAVVFECTDMLSGSVFAAKFLASTKEDNRLLRFKLETKLLEQLSETPHDHLIKFITHGETKVYSFDRKSNIYVENNTPFFIMERASYSLRDYIKKSPSHIAPEIYFAQFRGLVSALGALHKFAIHRDIKPENILVVGERWVISDLGLCIVPKNDESPDLTKFGQIPGPRFWLSPEANNRSVGLEDEICSASDIFQLASVFWWIVTRRHPSGILVAEDWTGVKELFEPIAIALQHSLNRRFKTASQFGDAVAKAIEGIA